MSEAVLRSVDAVRQIVDAAFSFPHHIHTRWHGPHGYETYESYKPWLRDEFHYRCAYCLFRETWYPNGADAFSVDHFAPQMLRLSGVEDYDNLFYACLRCNSAKGVQPGVLNPCETALAQHLRYTPTGNIEALTPEGRVHIGILQLDDIGLIGYRRQLIETLTELRDPMKLIAWLGPPNNTVNLKRLRPPGGNTRPAGMHLATRHSNVFLA